MPRERVEKLHAEKSDFKKQGYQVGETKKIGFAFSRLAEWWKWKRIHWLTMRHCVWMQPGTMWRCGGIPYTKKYSPPSGNKEYHTTGPQHETLCSRMLCRFAYFAVGHACRTSIFLPSTEYRMNVEVECYHRYNNCYILITRTVFLLSPYRRTHCFPDRILLAVSALQGSRD